MALTVTLLGGVSSGNTTLAQSLLSTLERQHGLQCVALEDGLRRWCINHGRTPSAHEQATIATEQTEHIAEAAERPGVDVVVADTTALMTAAYSEQYFQDTGLWAQALRSQSTYAHTWLMGQATPCRTDGLLRKRLDDAGLAYATLWGTAHERLAQALHTLKRPLGLDLADGPERDSRRTWRCENCADPESEHRLFGFCPRA